MHAVLFIGIQASGKSSFTRERFFDSHLRLNLDMLRTRHREERLLRVCLETQMPFVVDNTNVTRAERARYLVPAKAVGYRISGYFFQCRIDDSLRRNEARERKVPAVGGA